MLPYKDKTVIVSGYEGFLGSLIVQELKKQGAKVGLLSGNTANPKEWEKIDDLSISPSHIFHFGAPSSQRIFERRGYTSAIETIQGMSNAIKTAQKYHARLVYPSTGLLSQGKSNEYARCKQVCEDMAKGAELDAIGARIFASYGAEEYKKSHYASVPYLFAKWAITKQPIVLYGDGSQSRDLIFGQDVAQAVVALGDLGEQGIVDLGSGIPTTFNELIRMVAGELGEVKLETIPAPNNYPTETLADNVRRKQLLPEFEPRTIPQGIHDMIEAMKVSAQKGNL